MAVTCRLGCGQSMQLKMLAEHEGSLCSERLVACRWQCLEDVKVCQAEVSRVVSAWVFVVPFVRSLGVFHRVWAGGGVGTLVNA